MTAKEVMAFEFTFGEKTTVKFPFGVCKRFGKTPEECVDSVETELCKFEKGEPVKLSGKGFILEASGVGQRPVAWIRFEADSATLEHSISQNEVRSFLEGLVHYVKNYVMAEPSEKSNVPDFLDKLRFSDIITDAEQNAARVGSVTLREDGSCVFGRSATSWERVRELVSENADAETQWCRVHVTNRTDASVAIRVPHKMIDAFFMTRATADSPPLPHGQRAGNFVFRYWTHGRSVEELGVDTTHRVLERGLFLTCAAKYHTPFVLLPPRCDAVMFVGFFTLEQRMQCQNLRGEDVRNDHRLPNHTFADRVSHVVYGCEDEPDKMDRRNVVHYALGGFHSRWLNSRTANRDTCLR